MEHLFITASFWLGLAVISAMIAYHLHISIALVEICVGVAAGTAAAYSGNFEALASDEQWLKFIASTGAILLTFLAGAELDPYIMKKKLKEVSVIGLIGFLAPFLGCASTAYYFLGWSPRASMLCGVTLSTTSMAVVYAVMLETGFNKTDFGKGILGACFINDLGTVVALGLIFSPFTYKTLIFIGVSAVVIAMLPYITHSMTKIYGNRTAAIRTKWIMAILFGLGALALWSGSEAVLPAYLTGMVLAGNTAKDHLWIRRFRTLTVGFLTPFYFLRAGTMLSLSALIAAPLLFIVLLASKVASKIFGLYPFICMFRKEKKEHWYYTLLMSTGLTFGTISALFGLAHRIINLSQYSFLVAAVIASAVIPTIVASKFFTPEHLLSAEPEESDIIDTLEGSAEEEG